MKRSLTILAAAVMLASVPALASSSSFGVTVNLGLPLPVMPVVPVAPAPLMVLPSGPGMSLAMGVPYDLVYYSNRYYARQEGRWYCSGRSAGPWQPITWRYLPERVRYRYEPVREVRHMAYVDHDRDGRYQRGGEYRRTAWQHDSRKGYEGYRIERGRDSDRHDHDDRR
jgi:hypothetical protein